jgi:hypothetical protein
MESIMRELYRAPRGTDKARTAGDDKVKSSERGSAHAT